ncbi:MAG: lipopolysaccharide transport periplasmic protein LptA [Cellvibrionaceae bacterium]|nr:lipopolysaccharide transport periplasmic protein LptA [Cellvibrionaceae bacterium]
MSRSTKLQRLSRAAGLAVCLLAGPHALALPSDRNQAITIHSDSAERDEIKGTTTYSGNVVMQQGSMRIDAEEVVIVNDKSKVTQIVATGKPARYQQKPSEEEGPVIAQANRLEYNIAQDTLHLIENALLQQEGTSLSGNHIDYDVKKSVVKAGSDASQNERVKMVIPARSLKQTEEE